MKNKKLSITKKVIAIICSIAMLVTGVFFGYGNYAITSAADTATISLVEGTYKFEIDGKRINVKYSGLSDCAGWLSFFDEEFASNYMLFGGGLDFAKLNSELPVMHLADPTWLQFFGYQSSGLTEGASFTILKGAPLKYKNTSGGTSTVTLDANYTFTFAAPTDSTKYFNSVTVEKTISLTEGTYNFVKDGTYAYIIVGYTGVTGCIGWKDFFDETFAANYVSYAGDLTFDKLNSELGTMHLVDDTQFQLFGSRMEGLAAGTSFTILKGAPFTYNTSGGTSIAKLDANYTFTFAPPTDANLYLNSVTVTKTENWGEEDTEKISLVNKKYDFVVEGGYINLNYTGISDFGGSLYQNFFDEEFSKNYVTYEGGLTYEALSTGLTRFCVETDSILQVLLEGRTEAFVTGASFTIKKGAPIPYKNTNGETVTIPLDADYIFIFSASTGGGSVYNDVQVIKSTSFAINIDNHLTSGANEGIYTDIIIPEENVTGYDETYIFIQDNTTYADYIDIAGIPYSKLSEMGVKLQFILVDGYRCLRIANWGELRRTLQVGDYMLFKKGMPLYYTTDSNSRYVKATLDSDYIYMVTDTTDAHNQYFKGRVYNSEHNKWVLPDMFSASTGTQGTEQIFNVDFSTDDSCLYTGYAVDLLENPMAKNYIDFAGYNMEEAAAMCDAILISTKDAENKVTNVLQLQFNETAVSKLKVRDMIVLKKGLPIIYTNTSTGAIDTAILDDEYTIVMTNKYDENGTTRLKFNCTLSGTYGLQAGELYREEGELEKYVNVLYSAGCFADAKEEFSGLMDGDSVMKKYFSVSGKSYENLTSETNPYQLWNFYVSALKGLRFSYKEFDLTAGDYVIFRKGLPVSYTTTEGRTRTAYLDKDYGFRYNHVRELFEYDATLIYQTSGTFGLKSGATYSTGVEGDYLITNIDLANGALDNAKNETHISLDYTKIKEYIKIGNLDWTDAELKFKVIRATNDLRVLQIRWYGAENSLQKGNVVQFKKGLPATYTATDGSVCTITLDRNYVFLLQEGRVGFSLMPIGEYTEGDLDGDDKYNDNDVSLMRKAMVGLVNPHDYQIDMDESGVVNSQDLINLKKQSEGSEDSNHIYNYTTIYENVGLPTKVEAAASITYDINQAVGDDNYVRLTFYASQNLTGTFTYTGMKNGALVTKTEDFYVEAGEIQFRQLFDTFRTNGVSYGITEKTLQSITLTNVGTESADVLLHTVESSPYAFDMTVPIVYLENGSLKIGMDLLSGGTLMYLERLNDNIHEVLRDKKTTGSLWWKETYYTAAIGRNFEKYHDADSGVAVNKNVNLINIYDRGREIQQSYYADVDEENGYIRGNYEAHSSGENWKYNPVQGGDQFDNSSQIIDYRIEDNYLYVKVRAMDWAKSNSTTKSYMENWYVLDDNQLSVKNSFVDWNGFTGEWARCSNEMPAVYLAHGLSTYVSQTASGEDRQTSLAEWAHSGGHVTAGSSEGWFAWVNEEDWGVGVYIPGISNYLSGRAQQTRYTNAKIGSTKINANAFNSPMLQTGYLPTTDSAYTQCYVQNTSYTAPVLEAAMEEYVPLEYTYVIQVDDLENIRRDFNTLEENDAVNNSGLSAWN